MLIGTSALALFRISTYSLLGIICLFCGFKMFIRYRKRKRASKTLDILFLAGMMYADTVLIVDEGLMKVPPWRVFLPLLVFVIFAMIFLTILLLLLSAKLKFLEGYNSTIFEMIQIILAFSNAISILAFLLSAYRIPSIFTVMIVLVTVKDIVGTICLFTFLE